MTLSVRNPGSTASSREKLLIIKPAPISSTIENAISATTSSDAARRTRAPALTRPGDISGAAVVSAGTPRADTSPNPSAVAALIPTAKANTPRLSRTSARPGTVTDFGISATSAREPHAAINTPITPALTARVQLSANSCATNRDRPAPSATRTAISRRRPSDLANNRFATLTHAINNTTVTAASISSSAGLVVPTSASRKDRAKYSDDWLLRGYSSASLSESDRSSTVACSSVTPGLSLATANVQSDFRAAGAWTGMLIGEMTSVGLLDGNLNPRGAIPTT